MSNFIEQTKVLKEDYDKEEIDQDEFERYLNRTISTIDLVFSNLVKTANLVKDFKQIAMTETDDSRKEISLKNHFQHIIESLDKHLKAKSVEVLLDIDKKININTYADALTIVMTNLILNSIVHVFNNIKNAKIPISVTKKSKKTVISIKIMVVA